MIEVMTENWLRRFRTYAYQIGFERVGITSADAPQDYTRYLTWLDRGFAGDLWYLKEEERKKKRGNLHQVLPGARSVIVGAISYAPEKPNHPSNAKFARYGWGRDYHKIVKRKLDDLAQWLEQNQSERFEFRSYVDTGPILERSLAERAGIGWIGKNTCVMNEENGSYIFLGEILTTLRLPYDAPALNRCGTCTRCLDACPTQALRGPYQLDAQACISYQTIENRKSAIPDLVEKELDGWVAGCDICQEVCPWNSDASPLRLPEFEAGPEIQLRLEDLAHLKSEEFQHYFGSSSFKRIGWEKLQNNAKSSLGKDFG